MATRFGLILTALITLAGPLRADVPQPSMGLKLQPLPRLVLQHLADPDAYAHFECKTEAGEEASGLYPEQTRYPDYQKQEAYSSPNGAFPDSHATWGGPPDKGDPGPLPVPRK